MNTENLLRAITLARIEYTKNNLDNPTKLYLDNVSAMKLEWHMKEHCNYTRVNDGKVMFAGMRVFPCHGGRRTFINLLKEDNMILDAAGKEVKVGDKVAYATQGYMSLNIGVVDSFTTKSIRMIVGKDRDWKYPAGDVYKDRILTRLPEQFVVIQG